jgi:hemolysin III
VNGTDPEAGGTPPGEQGPEADPYADKPLFRGRMHRIAFFISIPAGLALVMFAQSPLARVAGAIYALSLAGLFGASAAYHTVPWSDKNLARMKTLDHSMIFVLIAGTYTPFLLLVIGGSWGVVLLALVWIGAITGIVLKIVHVHGFQVVSGTLYIVLGWIGIVTLPKMLADLPSWEVALVVAGALTFTGGAIILLTRKPDPNPRVFGYHEVWHTAVVLGCICYYVVTLFIVAGA